jgi:hypothetical protein
MEANVDAVLESAERSDWPPMMVGGSIYLGGEETYRSRLPTLPPALIEQTAVQLRQHAGARARRLEMEARRVSEDSARDHQRRPLSDDEPEAIEARELEREAAEIAARGASPMTMAQGDAMLRKLDGILDALQRR